MQTQPFDVEGVFQALGDAALRRIIEQLGDGEASVSSIAKPLGISLAAVVQHIQVLERSALVSTEKVGRVRQVRLEPGGLAAAEQWTRERRLMREAKLDRLGALLDESGDG